jgi:hypothetical protein
MAEVREIHQAADAVHVPRDDLAAVFLFKAVKQLDRLAVWLHMDPPSQRVSAEFPLCDSIQKL